MPYFKNYPKVSYKFGNETSGTEFQQVGAYIDVLDLAKDNLSSYQKINIYDGDRPDQASFGLYDDAEYYWTMFMMNDHVKLRGWPLSYAELVEKVQREYPHQTLTTRANLADKFLVGSTISGSTSGATGTVLRRRVDLGQIIVETDDTFLTNEEITTTEDDQVNTAIVDSVVEEYNATHHYEDANGNYIDIFPNAPLIQRISYEISYKTTPTTRYVIDDIKVSNFSSINTDFSLGEVTTAAIYGNLIQGGTAPIITAALVNLLQTEAELTVTEFETQFLVGILGLDASVIGGISGQLDVIRGAIAGAGGTVPTSFVFHTFTLVDNQLNYLANTPSLNMFEFFSDVSASISIPSIPFSEIEANIAADEDNKNLVAYQSTGLTFTEITESPYSSRAEGFTAAETILNNYIANNFADLQPAQLTPVTFREVYERENEELQNIRIVKPDLVQSLDTQYKKLMAESNIDTTVTTANTNFRGIGGSTTSTSTTSSSSSSSSGGGSSGY